MTPDPRGNRPSASGIEQMSLCPGSRHAQMGLPELPRPTDAEEVRDSGIDIHAALAGDTTIREKLSSDDTRVYDDMDQKAFTLAEELGFNPDAFIPEQRLYYPPIHASALYAVPPPLLAPSVSPVPVSAFSLQPLAFDFSGQSDRTYLKNGIHALVLDFKSGFLPATPAEENPQLAALAILAVANHHVGQVTVAIIPRFGRPEPVTYALGNIHAAHVKIQQIIEAADQPDAPRQPGEKQCKYCRAKTRCPERLALFPSALSASSAVKNSLLPALPAADLAGYIEVIPEINDLIKSLKAEAKRRLADHDPDFTQLYTLTEGRTVRTITNLPVLYSRLALLGVTIDAFTAQCSLPIGEVKGEKVTGLKGLLHTAGGQKGKPLDDATAELLEGCVTETQTAGSLKKLPSVFIECPSVVEQLPTPEAA